MKQNKLRCLILSAFFLLSFALLTPLKASAASDHITANRCVENGVYLISLTHTGSSYVRQIEFKFKEIKSTKDSRWKKAYRYTGEFHRSASGRKRISRADTLRFARQGKLTFRFTLASGKKLVKTYTVDTHPSYKKGKVRLTGTLKRAVSSHPFNGMKFSTYVLVLKSPLNFKPSSGSPVYIKEKILHVVPMNKKQERKFKNNLNKKAVITGKIWPGAGTAWYPYPVCLDPASITIR